MSNAKLLTSVLLAGLFLASCNDSTSVQSKPHNLPQAVLAIKDDSGYRDFTEYEVPKQHTIGDGTIAFEGPGIESAKIGYRLYLDSRSVLDVFGKTTSEPVLQRVGRGDDYHTLSDWGMDILKVGDSLGAGGLGTFQNSRLRQLGRASKLRVEIPASQDNTASFIVSHEGLSSGRGIYSLRTDYSMSGDSRRLSVNVQSSKNTPQLATGLVKHAGTQRLTGQSSKGGKWAYLATWGNQAFDGEPLGLALFYRTDSVTGLVEDEFTDGIAFNAKRPIHYEVAAAWSSEPNGITGLDAFEAYLEAELVVLENPESSDTDTL